MQRMVKGENLEFSAAQTSSLDQWWCQQLSRDQFLNKGMFRFQKILRRHMHGVLNVDEKKTNCIVG